MKPIRRRGSVFLQFHNVNAIKVTSPDKDVGSVVNVANWGNFNQDFEILNCSAPLNKL